MKLVRQPKDTNMCGQCCVATICDIPLHEACVLSRTKGRTTTKRLIGALRMMGMLTGYQLDKGMPESGLAILKFTHTLTARVIGLSGRMESIMTLRLVSFVKCQIT